MPALWPGVVGLVLGDCCKGRTGAVGCRCDPMLQCGHEPGGSLPCRDTCLGPGGHHCFQLCQWLFRGCPHVAGSVPLLQLVCWGLDTEDERQSPSFARDSGRAS